MYFEYNFPKKAPFWMHPEAAPRFTRTLKGIASRMDKLERALLLSGMKGETFAKYAKVLFDSKENFDSMADSDIAYVVKALAAGQPEEPNRMVWPNANVVVDTAFVRTAEWEALRHFGLGGSDAAVVLGISPYTSPVKLAHDKVGDPVKLDMSQGRAVFDRGHAVEPKVIEAFCRLTGAKVIPETRMFVSKTHPNCTANIDAIVKFDDGRMFVFEAKTTVAENFSAWSKDQIPHHYVPQMRQYPAVLNDDRILGTYIGCYLVKDAVVGDVYVNSSVNENAFFVRYIEREEDAEEAQLDALEDWFNQYIEGQQLPAPTLAPTDLDHPDASEIDVMRQYSGPCNGAIENWELAKYEASIAQYLEISDEISDLKRRADGLDEKRKAISMDLIRDLGQSQEARLRIDDDGNYYEVKYSPREKTTVDTETLTAIFDAAVGVVPPEMLARMRGCITENPEASRVFSVRKKKERSKSRK